MDWRGFPVFSSSAIKATFDYTIPTWMTEGLPGPEIMSAIRAGDRQAFEQVFDTCYESLCHYAYTLLRDRDEAEDTVQAMFVKLWELRSELEIKQTVRAYLFRAVYNQCMNQREHRVVMKKHEDYQQYSSAGNAQLPEVFVHELEEKVRQAVDGLPPQCRTIFMMSRYEELHHNEIAERLTLSVNTVQNQVCKALKILREQLRDVI